MTAFNDQLRRAAKEAIKFGMTAGERIQEATAEAYERGQDLIAEVRAERAGKQSPPTSPPERRSPSDGQTE